MTKESSMIIVTIVLLLTTSIVAIQPNNAEASVNLTPSATPSPRTRRPRPIQSPKPVQSPVTRNSKVRTNGYIDTSSPVLKTSGTAAASNPQTNDKVRTSSSKVIRDGKLTADERGKNTTSSPKGTPQRKGAKPTGFQEVSGIGMEVTSVQNNSQPNRPTTVRSTNPCPKSSNVRSPRSNPRSTQVMNKNCQEFEAVVPTKPRENAPAQYNPKEVGIDKVVKQKAGGNSRTASPNGRKNKLGNFEIQDVKANTPAIPTTPNNRKVKNNKNQTVEVENDETHLTQNPAYREGGVNDSTVRNDRTPSGYLKIEGIDGVSKVRTTTTRKPAAAQPAKRKARKPRN